MAKPGRLPTVVKAVLLMTACAAAGAAEVVRDKDPVGRRGEKGECVVADFRTESLTTHDTKARAAAAQAWLQARARTCSVEQFEEIRANRSLWLGAADTPFLAGLLESLIAAKAKSDSVAQVRSPTAGKEGNAAP